MRRTRRRYLKGKRCGTVAHIAAYAQPLPQAPRMTAPAPRREQEGRTAVSRVSRNAFRERSRFETFRNVPRSSATLVVGSTRLAQAAAAAAVHLFTCSIIASITSTPQGIWRDASLQWCFLSLAQCSTAGILAGSVTRLLGWQAQSCRWPLADQKAYVRQLPFAAILNAHASA